MPTVKKEAVSEAVGAAIEHLFGDEQEGGDGAAGLVMDFIPNADGTVTVSEPADPDAVGPFIEALEGYLEEEEVRKMDEAARASMDACGICKYCLRMPCAFRQEYDTLMEIGASMEADNRSNTEIRFALYAHMSHAYFGRLGAGNRKKLPACIVGDIHDAYPAEAGTEYVGFKESSAKEE